MFLFVGIGNVGKKYENTRHNVGFIFIDEIAKRFGGLNFSTKFLSDVSNVNYNSEKIILLKPNTFVNASGDAVQLCKKFYKIEDKKIFVFYDDIATPLGKVKIVTKSSSGGHNGIKSIISSIGNEFVFVKFGLKNELFTDKDAADIVLSKFSDMEKNVLQNQIKILIDNLDLLLSLKQTDISILVEKLMKYE